MWKNYLKSALRNLSKYRINTVINVLGIALGISGAIVVYTILRSETNFDAFHSRAADTYRIVQHNHTAEGTQYWNTTAYPLASAIREEFPDLGITQTEGPVSGMVSNAYDNNFRFEENKILFVDREYLSVFDFSKAFPSEGIWISGNPQTAFELPNSVVLTEKTAQKYFKGTVESIGDILGKELLLNDKDILTITGIVQDPPRNTSLSFDLLVSFEFFRIHNAYQANNWSGNYQGTTFIVLPDDQSPADFEGRLVSMQQKYLSPEENQRIEYVLQPLKDIHTETLYGSSPGSYTLSRGIINGLVVLAVFLLFIGCINFINLATAQSFRRSKEVGLRKVLGGNGNQIMLQFMAEAFFIVLMGFVLAILVSQLVIGQLNRLVSFVQFDFLVDLDFLLKGALLVVVIAIASGFYPALVLSNYAPVFALKNKLGVAKENGFSARQLLIVFQFCIAQFLIAGTVIVALQMDFFRNKELGYNKENVLILPVPESNPDKMEVFRQNLLQSTAVDRVSFSSGAPTTYDRQYGTTYRLGHEPLEMRRETEMKMVDPEYMDVYKLDLVAGTWLGESNRTEMFNGFVVNESLLHSLGLYPEEAIGQKIIINEGEAPILGVVQDFHNNTLQEGISPCVFLYYGTGFLDQASILVSQKEDGEPLANVLQTVGKSWKEVYPDGVFSAEFLDESLERYYQIENMVYLAFQVASGIAIFIGCLGLYGLVTLVSIQRTKELGIRKVLGATTIGLLKIVSWDFVVSAPLSTSFG